MKIDTDFAEALIAEAMKSGADHAEVFLKSSKNLSVEIKDQSVDSLNSSLSFGYSLRVIKAGRLGFSYSTSREDKDAVVRNAVEAADYPDEDPFLEFPVSAEASDVRVYDPLLQNIREDEAISMVANMESSVYAEDRRIKKVRKASGSFTVSETAVVNSRAVSVQYASSSCSAQIMAIAGEGDESQVGWDYMGNRFLDDVDFEAVGRNAARRAVRLLGSRNIQGCRASVVLDNSVTVDFLGILASSLSSEAVQKGKSLLTGKLGTRVINSGINIIDSGLLDGRLGSAPVDGEGVPSQEKILIHEGVLKTFLYNTYTANKGGTVSTGNAVRGGFGSLPSVGITNLFISSASGSAVVPGERLFGLVKRGLYVVEAMGVHTANPISGEFSVGVNGIWLEDGEQKYPVKEAVISGNILDFFDKIVAVGDDLRFYGNMGAPGLVINDVDISA